MFELSNLTSLVKKRKRVGRGGSRGGTSGKGHKGQKARSGGYVRPGFEGGQMPLFRRLPKRGFNNTRFQTEVKAVNIDRLDEFFEDGSTITREALLEKGIIKGRNTFLVKILGDGLLKKKFIVEADAFSKAAVEAIERCGGQVKVLKER